MFFSHLTYRKSPAMKAVGLKRHLPITDADALSQLAASANAQQVTTSMIGFADGYDEQLLAALADAGGGNDYWCAGPDQATKVFADEFAGLASVVAQCTRPTW